MARKTLSKARAERFVSDGSDFTVTGKGKGKTLADLAKEAEKKSITKKRAVKKSGG